MAHVIIDLCTLCGTCAEVCPTECIKKGMINISSIRLNVSTVRPVSMNVRKEQFLQMMICQMKKNLSLKKMPFFLIKPSEKF